MSYLVLARKYRPQSFEDLVGQEHVAKTLANAIAQGRVAHAFLFTGVRGVGKTTSARLLAKCLNCLGADGKATGPTSTPCQTCAACTEIAAGTDMDVQEIDGASYNGVDEVRRLQEGLAFRPARDRFKIYIVDEVHMLSNAAWNAFLKTLEEPPPHVKFIFATTEVHKVPVTILSRCQRYDFKLLPTLTIHKRLAYVLGQEKIAAEDSAISILAREAAGSMRDAMSLLDQVIAFSGDKLTSEDVARVLGVAERRVLHELAGALVKGDALTCIKVIDGVSQQGFDIAHTARDLLRHLRDVVVAKVGGPSARELLDLADEEVADVVALAEGAEVDDLTRLYQGFSKGFDEVVKSGQPRAALEVLLVRLARRPALLPLDELLVRIADLEKRIASGAAPNPPPRGGARAGATSITSELRAAPAPRGEIAEFQAPPMPPADIANEPRGPRASGGEPVRAGSHGGKVVPGPHTRRPSSAPEPWDVPFPGADGSAALAMQQPAPAATQPTPTLVRPSADQFAPTAPLVHTVSTEAFETYRAIIERVRAVKAGFAAIFENAVLVEVSKDKLHIAVEDRSFLADQMSEPEGLDVLTRETRAHFGASTHVEIERSSKSLAGKATVAAVNAEKERERLVAAREKVLTHPLVQEAIRLFDAKADVRLPNDE